MDQSSATQIADIWAPHLKPGERLVWRAEASAALRAANLSRRRLVAGATAGASAIVCILLLARLLEAMVPGYAVGDLGAAVAAPLYLAFAAAFATLAVWGLRNLNPTPPAARHFAATDGRLIALDASGAITDEIAAADIDRIIAGGRHNRPDLYVLRKGDEKENRAFAIEHIDRPLEAKAILEQTFMEHAT